MSGSIGGVASSGYGLLGQLIQNSGDVRHRLDTLTAQASSGLISNTYAGLGSGSSVSLAVQPRLDSIKTWQANIDAVSATMDLTQSSMQQVQQIASDFLSKLTTLTGVNQSGIDTVAAQARDALGTVANLLNTQDGTGAYIFAGADSRNPPVPLAANITTSPFYQQISGAVAGLSANGAAATAASTLAIASSNAAGTTPFSAYLSQGAGTPPQVQVGANDVQPTGLLANNNSAVVSLGGSTTGSYMRDLMRSLATIGSMSSTQGSDPGFATLVQDTRTSLSGAIDAMGVDVGVLGDRQAALTQTRSHLDDTATALSGQLSGAQSVDMATTLSNITAVQAQLQASYQLIVNASSLTLAHYLPVA